MYHFLKDSQRVDERIPVWLSLRSLNWITSKMKYSTTNNGNRRVKNIRKYLGEKNNLLDDGDELMKDWKDQNNNEFIFTITFFCVRNHYSSFRSHFFVSSEIKTVYEIEICCLFICDLILGIKLYGAYEDSSANR